MISRNIQEITCIRNKLIQVLLILIIDKTKIKHGKVRFLTVSTNDTLSTLYHDSRPCPRSPGLSLYSDTGYQAKTQHLPHIISRGHIHQLLSTFMQIYIGICDLCTNPIYCWCMSKVCQNFLARFPLDDNCCYKSADKCSTRPSKTRHLLLSSDPQPWPGSLTVDSICFENINIKTIQKPKYQQVRSQLQLPIPVVQIE